MDKLLQQKRIYYSQNREDIILDAFFPDIEKGFYVDIGANDPLVDSVTKLFYDKGWHGINIEPITRHYEALNAQRSRDTNLNIGAGEREGILSFNEYVAGDGLSTFSDEMVREHRDKTLSNGVKNYTVAVKPLRDILKANKVRKIHFMKVDVEGFEYEVLAGNDWKVFRPEVICIESNHIVKDWRPLLKRHDYELAFFDGLNEYYVDSHTSRHKKFDYVNRLIIEKEGGIRASDYELLARLDDALHDTRVRLQEIQNAKVKQGDLYQSLLAENHRNHTRAVIAERALRQPIPYVKYQLKRLHHLILRKLSPRPVPDYSKDERKLMDQALADLSEAKDNKQLLRKVKHVAAIETIRLERIYKASKEVSVSLRAYKGLVEGVKRLRLKGLIK